MMNRRTFFKGATAAAATAIVVASCGTLQPIAAKTILERGIHETVTRKGNVATYTYRYVNSDGREFELAPYGNRVELWMEPRHKELFTVDVLRYK